jgi:transcription initiation factor TFIIF subunit alpha
VLPTAASAIQEQQQKIESRTETPKPNPQPRVSAPAAVKITGSRPTSPGLSPSHSGHSVVAKRATSPHFPKPKVPNIPNGGSLFVGQANAVQSTTIVDGVNSNATKVSLKRKADTATVANTPAADGQPPKSKKRKATVQGSTVSSAELESMLLEWLKTTTDSTTRDCIQNFTPYLVDSEKKAEFSAMVRKHATLKNGVLVPKSSSSPPSPPA